MMAACIEPGRTWVERVLWAFMARYSLSSSWGQIILDRGMPALSRVLVVVKEGESKNITEPCTCWAAWENCWLHHILSASLARTYRDRTQGNGSSRAL